MTFGYCPQAGCGAPGVTRTRGIPSWDTCTKGHRYLASMAMPGPTFQSYVCGFLFSPCGGLVVLIEKNRPAWQAGKLNGIGGKVERGESAGRAMSREFYEETGVLVPISDWGEFATLSGPDFRVHFYRAFADSWYNCRSVTDEQVRAVRVSELAHLNAVPNLQILIPLALSKEGLDVVHLTRGRGDEAKAA